MATYRGNGTGVAALAAEAARKITSYANDANPEFETEWESHEAAHGAHPEREAGELFIGRALERLARAAIPVAKRLAPLAARTIVGSLPGVGAAASPLAGQLVQALLREGAQEAAHMEAQYFGANPSQAEIAGSEAAHEAALMEVLAAEASHSASESEASALLGTGVPIAFRVMRASRSLRPLLPTLLRANTRLVRLLHRRGHAGRRLLRLLPSVLRATVASIRAAQRAGYPISPALARRLMAGHSARILGSPQQCGRMVVRNAIIWQRTVAPARSL